MNYYADIMSCRTTFTEIIVSKLYSQYQLNSRFFCFKLQIHNLSNAVKDINRAIHLYPDKSELRILR